MITYTTSEENYIKSIYHLEQHREMVSTNDLAAALKTKPASVTDMMKKLKAKKLLNYQPYKGFRLSSEGKKVAINIIRRHRLWEYFLAEKLKFSWDEVHEVAEELEHIGSKKLIDRLDKYLDYPRVDPHGDPIPDADGKMDVQRQVCLADLSANIPAIVSKVTEQSSEILELLTHKNIMIGTKIEIKKRFEFDRSLEIKVGRLPIITISEILAKNIYVNI